jgi:hypothetical protein
VNKYINVIDCVSQAQMELGLSSRPVRSAVTSADQDISQMVALLYAVADELLLSDPYQVTLGDGVWLADAATGAGKEKITADSDIILFDQRLAVTGVKFRFLKAKGLEFAEELRDFSDRLNRVAARVNARVLDLDEETGRVV